MRWLLTFGCVAGLALSSQQARADEAEDQVPAQAPTTPQVPMPVRAPWPPPGYYPQQMGAAPAGCAGGCQNCANGVHPNVLVKFKNWLCFCYETRDALPRVQFAPHYGPFMGSFMCGSPPAGCAGPGGCAGGRGCQPPTQYAPPMPRAPEMPPTQMPPAQMPPVTSGQMSRTGFPRFSEPMPLAPVYPTRGCQGAAMPMVIESRTLNSPSSATAKAMIAQPAEIVNVEFRTPATINVASGTEFTCGFVAAAPIARQMLSPVEMISRTGTLP